MTITRRILAAPVLFVAGFLLGAGLGLVGLGDQILRFANWIGGTRWSRGMIP